MVTYVRTACRCCGEEIDWTPVPRWAPRCDDCRRYCLRPRYNLFGKRNLCRKQLQEKYE